MFGLLEAKPPLLHLPSMTQSTEKPQAGGTSLLNEPEAGRLLAAAATDAAAPREEFCFAPPAAWHKPLARLLEDPRDLPILYLYLNVLLTTVPAAAALFWAFPPATRPLPHLLGLVYLLANYIVFLARFMLSLHYSQHRRLFKKGEPGWIGVRCWHESACAAGDATALRVCSRERLASPTLYRTLTIASPPCHHALPVAQGCGLST